MVRSLAVLGGVCLLLAPVRADEQARKLVEQAVRAHGGTVALERARTMVRSSTGTMNINGMDVAFSSELTSDLPDRYRLDVELGPQKTKISIIVLKEAGWEMVGGVSQPMAKERHLEALREGYTLYLSTLVPARDGKDMTLTSVPEIKVFGKPALGVEVANKGRDKTTLYFDKDTGLLVQITRKGSLAGFATTKEYLFSEFKEFNGAKLPTKHVEQVNGTKYMEGKSSTYRFPSRPDERAFQKP